MGGRFYALCNCCKCCCFGMEAITKYAVPMVASSGYVEQVGEAVCEACAACEEACYFEAIQVKETASCALGDLYGVWSVCGKVS